MLLKNQLYNFENNPKKLFLIDGIGALISVLLLGVVLVKLESVFGIPSSSLYILAVLPIFFSIYDLYYYKKESKKLGPPLKGIAIVNIMYCCLSLGFSFYHIDTVTLLGWGYIIVEIIIVISLALIELKIANQLIKLNNLKK